MQPFGGKNIEENLAPIKENVILRVRTNRELQELYNNRDIIKYTIRARKVQWLGHASMMKRNRIPK